jgi:glycerate 2-kinase
MRIVIAPDSFKECASALEVAKAVALGFRHVFPTAEILLSPMADGGEGTVDALVAATGGSKLYAEVTGPVGEPVQAAYALLGDGETAVVEMAAASGLALVPRDRRDPRYTTSRGTGELIRCALDAGVKRIIVGLGGSGTNDGGAGMAQALGYRLLDDTGHDLPPGGAALYRLSRIDDRDKHPRLDHCLLQVACDVVNPLCGPHGASHTYGPQKGASPEAVEQLDAALRHFAAVIEAQLGVAVLDTPGAGAAGGLGAGLIAFTGAQLRPGVDLVAEAIGLSSQIAKADLVVTGEGRLDGQTIHGKTPAGVARIARMHRVPVVAIAGALGKGYETAYEAGISAAFSLCRSPMTLDEAIAHALPLLSETAEAVARLWMAGRTTHEA